MGNLFSKASNATTPQQLNAINVDRSRYGDPIPLVYGMQRIPLTLLWYGAFTASAQTNGSGKGGHGQVTGYNYTASCVMGLCEGPIQAIYTVWKDKNITTIANEDLSGPFLGAGGQAIWTYLTSNFPSQAVPYDHTAYVGGISLNLGGSAALPNYTFEVQGFLSAESSTSVTATAAPGSGATSFVISGTSPVADGFWDVTFSDYETRTATQTTSGGVSTMSWDTTNPLINNVTTTVLIGGWDAEPSAIIEDYCTDPNHGAGFNFLNLSQIQNHSWTSGGVTYFDNYRTYCIANGLYISPWEDTQRAASDCLKDIMQITNSNVVVSAGSMKIVPYGDNTVSGNGLTYTPDLQPLFAFTDDDYVQAGANNIDDPVCMIRKPLTETYNVVPVEFYDRGNAYNAAIARWEDPLDIAENGIRVMGTITLHQVTQASVAAKVAALIGQRQLYVRNQYSFSVRNDAYTLLEPMDLIAITDSSLGINDLLCRVVQVTDDKDDTFTITCEDMLIGTAAAPLYNFQASQGYKANYSVVPPSVATPVIFTAPPRLVGQGGGFELWIAVGPATPTSSQTNDYGGCNVSASLDDQTWTSIGQVIGSARFGTVTSIIGVNDTTIYLTMNPETYDLDYFLQSASASDFANNRSLLYVDGEIMGFETVTLLSPTNYSVTVSRGLFDSEQSGHVANTLWSRLDQNILKMPIDPGMIGQTIYFEFATFNSTGHEVQAPTTYSQVIGNSGGFNGLTPLINGGGCTIVGNEAFKSATTSAWDSSCYSQQSFTNGCSATAYPSQTNGACMFGLTRNPTSSNNYTNIAYGWYFDNSGTLNIVESGSSVFTYTLGSFSTSDFYQVTHDGKHVCYYRNGVLVRSVVDATDTFYLQACFYNSAAAFYGIEFTNTAAVVTPFTLEALSTNVAVNGTRVQANTAVTTDAWGLRNFQSVQSYANGCALSASATGAGGALYIGLSTAPAVTTTPLSVLAGWYVHGDSSQCNLIYNGATIGAAQSAWVSGDVFEVTYDMFNFRWFRNGVLLTQQAATGVAPLYVFGDFYDPALCFEEISFQPIGAATPTQWTAYGTATATDSYITQHGGPADYSSGALSINSFSTCNVLFKANQTTAALIVGFTTFSTSTLSSVLSVYTANYGIYLNDVGQVYTVENGTFGSFVGDYTTSDLFSMSYDGSTVTYYQNGISFATSSVSGASFRAVVNLAGTGATCGINSVDFGPGASVPVVDTAQIGPNAATTTYFIENDSTENVTYAGSILYGSPAIQLPYVPAPQLSFTAPGNAGSTVNAIVTVMTSVYLTNTSGTTTPNATVIAAIQDTSSGTQLDYFPKIAAAPYYNAGGSTTSSQTAPQQIAVHDNVTLTAGHSYNVYLACQTDASSVTAHFTGTQIQVEVIKK